MKKINVVIADDSPFVCSMLSAYLKQDGDINIADITYNGLDTIDKIKKIRPDVATVDLEMPGVNGLEVIESVMYECPTPIVVVSGISRNASEITLKALELGAVDFILKYTPGVEIRPEHLKADIISKVKAASRIRVIRSIRTNKLSALEDATSLYPFFSSRKKIQHRSSTEIKPVINPEGVLVIGASTGGPVAIKELLNNLDENFPMAIVIVQHMNASFTRVFASQLDKSLKFRVKEAEDGDSLLRSRILVAPGDFHLIIGSDLRVKLTKGPKVKGHRPSIDVTMQSVAQIYGSKTTGVILTGMGDDGTMGLLAIKSKWGNTFVQSPEDCVIDGMPKSAIAKGVVDHVATASVISALLGKQLMSGRNVSAHTA